ncbi:MAG: acyl carrier protein [Flavobacterium sp.]|nr:acyl carrier protein [Flavobacterium sp.]
MENKFLTAIKEALEIEDRDIALTDVFRDFDEWDSLSRLSLIAMLDDDYDVAIEDEVFKSLITLGDLFNEVQNRISK